MSYKINHFADASQFTVVNGILRYYYTGNSYLEKLKNGLSLDSVIRCQMKSDALNSEEKSSNSTSDVLQTSTQTEHREIDERFLDFEPPQLRTRSKAKKPSQKSSQKPLKNPLTKGSTKLTRTLGSHYKEWEYDQSIPTDEVCDEEMWCTVCANEWWEYWESQYNFDYYY
jgi:hypothetical protein